MRTAVLDGVPVDRPQERGGAVIMRDVTLDLPRTAVTALIGPSGAGKTSLLRLLNRLDDPSVGEVWLPVTPSHARRRNRDDDGHCGPLVPADLLHRGGTARALNG